MRIDALHLLAVEHRLQTEHAVGRGVLRTDVDDIVVGGKEAVLLRLEYAVLVEIELQTIVGLHVVLERVLVVELPVLAEGIALEVAAEEEAAHVGMAQEDDAEEVVDLALQQVSHAPDVRDGGDVIHLLSVLLASAVRGDAVAADLALCQHLNAATLVSLSVFQNIDTTEALFAEIFTNDGNEVVKAFLLLQVLHFLSELVKIE